ncbi:hypothetical protein AB0L40_22120 [Patulibacter sp. NPDC049589]|uniref:hypothetical protein n=1 Tax=Patulibacter sp. NPDC049589 TaxID=3154731 RepID=UPI0034295EF9
MSDEPIDDTPEADDAGRAEAVRPLMGAAGGRSRWTVAIPDAKPGWAAIRKAVRAIRPQELFEWTDAHRLPDGTRVDEFVHRESTILLFLGEDGRAWHYRGMGPGAVGPSVLLEPAPDGEVARTLAKTACDRCLHEVRRECWRHDEPMPWARDLRPGSW